MGTPLLAFQSVFNLQLAKQFSQWEVHIVETEDETSALPLLPGGNYWSMRRDTVCHMKIVKETSEM